MTGRGIAALAFWLWGGLALAAEPVATAVLFNTVCANCHDLECSGGLSPLCAQGGAERARGHMERHAGSLSGDTVAGLFSLLEEAKKGCLRPFPTVPVPAERVWDETALRPFLLPSGKAAFIPLGELAPGSHRWRVTGRAETVVRAEILAGPDQGVGMELHDLGQGGIVEITLEEKAPTFLRLRSAQPFRLTGVSPQ
jgi:hypothetical protein